MRCKLILLLSFVILAQAAFSEDESKDIFSDITDFSNDWAKQKVIPTGDFEKTLEKMKGNERKKGRNAPTELMPSSILSDDIQDELKKEYAPTILVPTTLIYENGIIPTGFYKISGAQDNKANYYINFYQGLTKIATIPAYETAKNNDSENINYSKFSAINEEMGKVYFGTLDFNIEAIVRIYKN